MPSTNVLDPSSEPALRLAAVHRQPGTRSGYLGVADVVRIFRRRRWLIVLTVAAVLLATLVFLARTQPQFEATTTVMVLPTEQEPPLDPSAAAPTITPTASEEAAIQTKVQLLQSRAIMREASRTLKLADDPEFAARAKPPGLFDRMLDRLTPARPDNPEASGAVIDQKRLDDETVTSRLTDRVAVARVGRSNVIQVTARSVDPDKATRIANRVVDTYIRAQIDDGTKQRRQDIAALGTRVQEIRGYLERADLAVASYRRSHNILTSQPEATGSMEASQLAGILAAARADSARDSRAANPASVGGGEISAMSPLLVDLHQQEATLGRKLAQLTSFYGSGYPEVIQTSAELTTLRSRIAQETTRLRADLGIQASASQAKSASLGASVAGIRSRSFGEGQAAVPLRALERNAEAVNVLYVSLLNQLNAKIGSPADVRVDIARVSRASAPQFPSYPLPKRVLAIAAIASLMLGMLLAFVIEMMDTRLRTAEQVRRLFGVPTLAMVPALALGNGPVHSAVSGRPKSRFAEAVRNLLIELESHVTRSGSLVVVVTSPVEGEGKNTIAKSLAAAAAVIGRQSVIVDFDLRRPGSQREDWPDEGAGVVAYLTDATATVDDLVPGGPARRTAVIGAGAIADDPGALIASPRLPQLIAQLRERFELIILNAPPILPVRDAKTLADHADATLLVVRWGRTTPDAAAAALELFDRPITGVVINRVDYDLHADRRYGDAIHHVARSSAYYDAETALGRNVVQRVRRWFRRRASATVEALHLA